MPNGSPLLRGNRLLMGNYTMPLRGHGIICAVQTTKPFAAAIWRLPLQSSGLRMLHHSQNRLCRFHCRFAAGKPEWACCCGIITAKRLLYRAMPNGSPLARQPPFDGQLYNAASRTWYNMRSANGKRCKAAGCACYATAKTGFTGFTAALRQFYGYATGAKPDGAPYLHGGRLLMGNISYRFSDMEYIVFSARHDAAGVGWGKEDA